MPPEGSRERVDPRDPAMQSHIAEETSSMRRNGDNDGNNIGKNITAIKRKQE